MRIRAERSPEGTRVVVRRGVEVAVRIDAVAEARVPRLLDDEGVVGPGRRVGELHRRGQALGHGREVEADDRRRGPIVGLGEALRDGRHEHDAEQGRG